MDNTVNVKVISNIIQQPEPIVTYFLNYRNLEDAFKKFYPNSPELNILYALECGNDTDRDLGEVNGWIVDGFDTDSFNWQDWQEQKESGVYQWSSPYYFIEDLVSKGHLLPGRYVIQISW